MNVIASATMHKSSRIMLAALKFFLGQDLQDDKGDSDGESVPLPRRVFLEAGPGPRAEMVDRGRREGKQPHPRRPPSTVRSLVGSHIVPCMLALPQAATARARARPR